jgi:hypothetical protein
MIVSNPSPNYYFLGSARYGLAAGATLSIPDAVYNADDAVASAINNLDTLNKLTAASTPSGYPRSTQAAAPGTQALIDASLARYSSTAAISSGYQPLDSDLTSVAALTTTSFGRGILDDADASAGRTSLGVMGSAVLFDSTLGGAAANIDSGAGLFATTYNVLEVWIIARTTQAVVGSTVLVVVNNDTGSNYDLVQVQNLNATVSGTNVLASAQWTMQAFGASAQAGAATVIRLSIPGYGQTTFHKQGEAVVSQIEDTAADARLLVNGIRWRSTAAISRMRVAAGSGNLDAGSRLLIIGR